MKRTFVPLVLLSLVLCACGPSAPATLTPSSTPSATTPAPSPSPSPSPTEPPPITTNASCNEIAFYLDPALATGYTCETVPADPGPMSPAPEMTRITLTGYPQSRTQWSERIYVISVAEWNNLDPILINDKTSELQGLLSASAPPQAYGTSGFTWTPPMLPDVGGIPVFFAQYERVPFVDGGGIRFLTELRFDAMPISNDGVIYTYQGLTSDGQYWVSAFLPIHNTALVADENTLPAGYATWNDFWAGYDPYLLGLVATLNAQPPGTFEPLIEDLDALVSSVTFVP